ncbi:hypothetical protein [Streptomyces sp. SID12488]|nr:hypothetical protein [Streptomyces sp. SID12488]
MSETAQDIAVREIRSCFPEGGEATLDPTASRDLIHRLSKAL